MNATQEMFYADPRGLVYVWLWWGVPMKMVSLPSCPRLHPSMLPRAEMRPRVGVGPMKCLLGEGASSHRRTLWLYPLFLAFPLCSQQTLEVRRRLQELQPSDAAELEAVGVAAPAHRSVWLWPRATQALGFTVTAADPSCRKGVGWEEGWFPKGSQGWWTAMVLVWALGRPGAGGGTRFLLVKEVVKRGLLGAGVEGWLCWSRGAGML